MRRAGCSRQLLFLYVLPAGVCSAPRGQWAASKLLKSGASRAQSAVKAGGSRRRTSGVVFVGVTSTQNESGTRVSALVAFRSSGGVGRGPCLCWRCGWCRSDVQNCIEGAGRMLGALAGMVANKFTSSQAPCLAWPGGRPGRSAVDLCAASRTASPSWVHLLVRAAPRGRSPRPSPQCRDWSNAREASNLPATESGEDTGRGRTRPRARWL